MSLEASSRDTGLWIILYPGNNEIPSVTLLFAPDSEIQKHSIAENRKYQSVLQYQLLPLLQKYLLEKTPTKSPPLLLIHKGQWNLTG